jgi:hypothetical protein
MSVKKAQGSGLEAVRSQGWVHRSAPCLKNTGFPRFAVTSVPGAWDGRLIKPTKRDRVKIVQDSHGYASQQSVQ